jgi:hypothetical protein
MGRVLFWLLAAVTLAVYLTMVTWTLPTISAGAGGLAPFDLRPTGYTFDEAKAFLSALTPEANGLYRETQHRLDLFFPGLLAAMVYFAIAALLPARLGRWRFVLPLPVVLVALFDWAENAAVARMLVAGAEGITPELVGEASRWSVLKAGTSTIVYTALLALLVFRGVAWLRRRRADA